MDVGGIGVGMMSGGATGISGGSPLGAPAGIVGQVAPGGAPPPTTVHAALGGSITGVEQLAQFLEGFTTSEILFALLLMCAGQKKDNENQESGFGFLAGMALAGLRQRFRERSSPGRGFS